MRLAMVIFNSLQDLVEWKSPASLHSDALQIRNVLATVVKRIPIVRTHAEEIERGLQ
ncbi:MAG: hypothetical protein NVS2B12_39670 [Ktedonobacteraceae bacterium]